MVYSEHPRSWTPPSFKTRILVYLFFFSLISSLLFLRGYRVVVSEQEWDVLIFTQHWPYTVCMAWEEKGPTNHTCRMPHEKDTWTVHGIWPTKLGTLGPTFCNSSYHFNASQLEPIMSNLTEGWVDVEVQAPTNSFWKHEWLKHGTCSASLPALDTELEYFQKGLEWREQYNMKSVLEKSGVLPDSSVGLDLTDIWLGVKTTLAVNPSIHCIRDPKTKQYYLQEIRICFDKNLVLTNCDGVRVRQQFHWVPLGNCPHDKPILYPNSVPSPSRKPLPPPPDTSIVSLLKSVQFLMWLTS